jgi:pimeloyl-ACP methyl ester carboxylesterase
MSLTAQADLVQHYLYRGYEFKIPKNEYNIQGLANNKIVFDKNNSLILRGYDLADNQYINQNIILFLGGSAFNYTSADRIQNHFNKSYGDAAISIYSLQYPGYTGSKIEKTEKNLTIAAVKAYKLLKSKFPNSKFSIWGHSLGAGVAAQVATRLNTDPNLVILTAAWTNFINLCTEKLGVLSSFICSQKHSVYKTNEALKSINSPIVLLHGSKDKMIPISHFNENISTLNNRKNQSNSFLSFEYEMLSHDNLLEGEVLDNIGNLILE